MSDPKTQQEPSMEEILASIRRIIAEDGEQAPAERSAGPLPQAASMARSEEVLELTEVVEDEPVKPSESTSEDWSPPAHPAEPEPVGHDAPSGSSDDRLVSDAAAAASRAALSQINQLGGRKEKPMNDIPLGGDGQRSIETIVREMLRPLLKEWLDSNLPLLVERVVQDEVSRLVRDVRRS